MIYNIVGLFIGVAVLCGGLYYLVKEKKDKQSRKIYSIFSGIGAAIIIFMIIKMVI